MSGSHLIVSCSLREGSHSAELARELADALEKQGREVGLIDLREMSLPFCDDGDCYLHPEVVRLHEAVADAATVTLAVPIYNFDVGGAVRNLVAVLRNAWRGKIVGFLCTAGGRASYMAPMSIANSLMLDFRCLIAPRFVYADRGAFTDGRLADETVAKRVVELGEELVRLSDALAER